MGSEAEQSNEGVRLTLEGKYTPKGYFEEPVTVERERYRVGIDDGEIVATIDDPDPTVGERLRDEIDRLLVQVFDAQQVMTGRSHELGRLHMRRHYPDGRKDVWVSVESALTVTASVNAPDIQVTDSEGNIVRDTKAERLDEQRRFRDQCLRHAEDPVLCKLLGSFKHAIDERANTLVHLYEIRDALKDRFGGEQRARAELQITKDNWSYLGRIANDEPIQEGRHRGLHAELRPATEEELSRCRSIAQAMIRAYLDHLD